ncbi:hypothetical protein HG531_006238 [Fusarium graminearum]|nr:hypothetical protein HG531_006238 [Fusarium graminearum]
MVETASRRSCTPVSCAVASPSMCRATLIVDPGIRNEDLFTVVENGVSVAGLCVDALDAVSEAEFLQGGDTAGLEKLADNAIGFLEPSLEEKDGSALVGESESHSAAEYTGSYDDDIGFMVLFAAAGLRLGRCEY